MGVYCCRFKVEQHADLAFAGLWMRPSVLIIEDTARESKRVLTQRQCRLSLSKLIPVPFLIALDVLDPPLLVIVF